jgi:photosystem II stability/assembly factor-like uncharacterized protein
MHLQESQQATSAVALRSPAVAMLLVAWLLTFTLPAQSANTDYALIMPKAQSSLLLDIAAAGDRLVAVGERGHILYSDDGGRSWKQARVPTSVMLTRLSFISASTGWAVGHDGNILLSTDGGLNWVLQRDGVSDQALINEDRVAYVRGKVSDLQRQLASETPLQIDDLQGELDEAESALEAALGVMDEPVYAPPLMDIWFANDEQGWASGAFGSLLHTTNGGRSWEDRGHTLNNPEEPHLNGLAGDSSGTLYIASEWGTVYRSTSRGESWEAIETGFEGSFFGIVVNPSSDSVFAYGLLGTIYRSTDHGGTWQPLDTNTRDSLFGAACAADGTLVFVGQNGTALLTDDDGKNLSLLDQGSRRGLYGVTVMSNGQFFVTGEGGSAPLSGVPDNRR